MKNSIIILIILFNFVYSQDQIKLDSLNKILKTTKIDTVKIKTLLNIGEQYQSIISDSALFYYQKALTLSKKTSNKNLKAECYRNIAVMYSITGKNDTALLYFNKALNIFKKTGNKRGQARSIGNIGVVYDYQSNYPKALEYYQKALKINKELGNKKSIALNLGNIGGIYYNQSNYPKALEYMQKALKVYKELGVKSGIARNLGNIGVIYESQSNYPKALQYYKKALKIYKELGDKSGIAINLGNIGIVYDDQNNYTKALEYYKKALKTYKELGDKDGVAVNLINIGYLYNNLKQYKKAIEYFKEGLNISKQIGALMWERNAYKFLSNAYKGLGNYRKALEYKVKFIELNDSIFNNEKTKDIAKLEAKYEYEKKAAIDSIAAAKQIQIKNAQIAKINTEKNAQRKQRNFLLMGLALILIFVVFVIRSYIQKQKANKLLTIQKQQIQKANEELNQQAEELKLLNENLNLQNEEITIQRDEIQSQKEKIEEIYQNISESIDYAKRIQTSILPDGKIFKKYISEYFILFRPKDIVSGDFYWATHIENYTIITVVDCTGHGVPGAFMSMLGASLLREIVEKEHVTYTGVILRKLRKEIIKALKQKGEVGEQKDGMDMAIISINHETNIVQFSGANNPLYIITNHNLENFKPLRDFENFYEIKPDKMPIAIYEKMNNFRTHEIKLKKGDQLYMFSDGFADQFGGPKGKKFKYKPFKRLLFENRNKPMKEQKEILEKIFNEWKQDLEQVDDVLVVGIKI